jgi:hypothetical protein
MEIFVHQNLFFYLFILLYGARADPSCPQGWVELLCQDPSGMLSPCPRGRIR